MCKSISNLVASIVYCLNHTLRVEFPSIFKMVPQLKPFQIYFNVFFLIGLNSFVSFTNEQKSLPKLLMAIPRLIAILGNIYIGYRECDNFPFHKVEDIFGRVALVVVVIVNLTAILENLCSTQILQQILCEISSVIDIMKTCLNIENTLKMVKKSLNQMLVSHATLIILSALIKYKVETINGKNLIFSMMWTICNTIKYIHLLHLEFYIEFIRHALSSLSGKLANKMNDRQASWYHGQRNELWQDIHYMKSVYLRLWDISQKVSSLFGWFLVICMLETISTAVYNVYWEFNLLKYAAGKQIPRKYNFIWATH